MGVSKEEVLNSSPKELYPYVVADKKRLMREDEMNWTLGKYINIAVTVAIANCFGKNSKAEYIKEPFMKTYEDEHKVLTEEEKLQQTINTFNMLEIIGKNFEESQKDKQGQ